MVKKILFAMVVLMGIAAVPRSAFAGCTVDLIDCYGRAAKEDGFWMRSAMGLDCELDYADCVRRKLLGR
jgi:hypothetical protein